MQQVLIWRNDRIEADDSLQNLADTIQDSKAVTWLDLYIPDTQNVQNDLAKYREFLAQEFQLTDLILDTIAEERERSKLVQQRNYFYLIVHSFEFNLQEETAQVHKLDIIFGHNYLITIHRAPLPWLDQLIAETRNDQPDDNIMGKGMARMLHLVLDTLVDSYFSILDTLDDTINDMEDSIVEKSDNTVQARVFRMKRAVAYLRRVVSPQIEAVNALVTRTNGFIPREDEPYFADVHDHLIRVFEVLDSSRDLMSSMVDVYLTTISNRQNEIMKQLAIIATIFLPITFITGVFGQNFAHSPQVEHDLGYNFWIVLIFMGIVTIAQLLYFRYRKWL
ncbi:MAG TPA: magnesium/cobalt transporter CorA [Ktedonobacteraceae bacterium]|jgi:magnesium transporter|nr:magnesium/cobalt transporter CorA [Ktedonobacteraceae bacterium]